MNLQEAIEMLKPAILKGIEITVNFSEEENCYFLDIHTMAKSHCYLYITYNDGVIAKLRYGRQHPIADFHDVMWAVRDCLCGRDYMNQMWIDLLKENDIWPRVK